MITESRMVDEKEMTTGYRPKQNIPEEFKDREWAIRNVDWCISVSPIYWKNYNNHQYDIYNGNRTEDDNKTITEMYGVEFPAGKIKNIPLIRPLLNTLEGEYEQRSLNFQVRTEDTDSVNQKIETMSKQLLDSIVQLIKSGEPIDVQMESLEKYYKEDFKSESEIAAHHALHYYIQAHHFERYLKDLFVDKMITGTEYYRTKINRIGEDPIFSTIRPGQLYFSNNNVKWVKETDWAVYPVRMSPTQVLDYYGERMEPNDRAKVEQWIDMYYKDSYKLNSLQNADNIIEDTEDWNNFYASQLGMITVYNVEWKSIRKVYYVENPNPYAPDAPFIKYIPENKLHTLKGESKKNLRTRFVQDLWEGLRIADNIYVDLGRVKYATRKSSAPSKVNLTFNGPTYSGKIKPYSLISETEDLQNLYNVLHYHKENLIAISGVKGMIMDASQIPDFGLGSFKENLKMWMYYKKLGTAWIDRSQEGVDRSFNQFGTYDDTLGAGLDAILAMISHLEELAGRIVGVNRQRQGAIYQRDGKATSENAIMQSALSTEPIFAEHDEVTRQALEDVLNSCKIAWKNGYTNSYISDQYLQQIFTFAPEQALINTGVYITNTESDKRSIDELKAFTYQLVQQGMMDFQDIMPLFRKSNLKDIQHEIDGAMTRKKKELEQKQAQAEDVAGKLEVAKTEAEVEKLKAEIKKIFAESEKIVMEANTKSQDVSQKGDKINKDYEIDKERLALEQSQISANVAVANKTENAGKAKQSLRASAEVVNK